MNQFMTYCAFGLGLAQIPFAINFFYSLFLGPKAGDNPWHSNTLEWQTTSPPQYYNFQTIPTVYHAGLRVQRPGRRGATTCRRPSRDRPRPGRSTRSWREP